MSNQLKPIVRAALLFMSVSLIVWILLPEYRTYAAGFLLGMMVSLINAWILLVKIDAFTRNIAEKTEKRGNLGTISRVCMALIAVMCAVKVPQIDLVFTIVGLFFVQMVTLVRGLLFSNKNSS
jgi:ATP synthase protein I